MNPKELHVLYISGNDFMPYTGISIESLFKNNKSFTDIHLHLFDRGIDKSNKSKIIKLCEKHKRTIHFYDITDSKFKEILNDQTLDKLNMVTSINTLSKLLISEIIPESIEKILYIDADSLVLGSLNDLWETDIANYHFSATEDLAVLSTFPEIKRMIGLNKNEIYVNAGIMLINLNKWREDNVKVNFITFLENNKSKYMDQDVFNGTLDKIMIIPLEYNVLPPFFEFLYKFFKHSNIKSYYSDEEIENSINNPIIFHFANSNIVPRPWFKGKLFEIGRYFSKKNVKKNKYKDYMNIYSEYIADSMWSDSAYINDQRSYMGQILYVLSFIPLFSTISIYIYKKLK